MRPWAIEVVVRSATTLVAICSGLAALVGTPALVGGAAFALVAAIDGYRQFDRYRQLDSRQLRRAPGLPAATVVARRAASVPAGIRARCYSRRR